MKYKITGISFSDAAHIIGGGTPKRSEPTYWNGSIPWLSVKDFNNDYRTVTRSSEFITELGLKNSSTKLLEKGDIIISARGTVGKLGQVDKPMAFNQSCFGIRGKKDIAVNDYLYYWLKYNIESLKKNTNGSVFDTINKATFDSLKINLPNIQVQNKISGVLLTFDEKIEMNLKLISILEELSHSLFKHWFIDFYFPNEQGLPYKSNGGKMRDSELGEIPEGWKVQNLVDICEVKDGTHDSPKQVEEGYPLVTSKHLGKNSIDFATTKLISLEDYKKVNKRSLVERNDILISMIGTVGRLYLVQDKTIDFAIKNIGLIKTSQIVDYEFIYCYLQSESMKAHIEERMAGSTQQYISLTELRKIPVLMPTKEALKQFKDKLNYLFDKVYSLTQEIHLLEDLSNSLLPKLLLGEIDIPDESVVD
ncbi:restriction endonuclease subunit S [Psychrobacillus sp. FSL H8-0487]|uniref:restriction endonuclease subunit S n=1 Tax=Psychrobacillus sp. FSL H8-0487 TaxID=2921391 RepID=UPI0030FC04CF